MKGDDKDDALGWQELLETAGGGVDDLEYETHHRAAEHCRSLRAFFTVTCKVASPPLFAER